MKTTIIIPCEYNRIDLLKNTFKAYGKFGVPKDTSVLIVTRDMKPFTVLGIRVGFLHYRYPGEYINPSMALNTGLKYAGDNVIVTSPEVMPITNVLKQFKELPRGNYLAQVWDLNKDGSRKISLVNKHFRATTPAMYFLAHFKREDLITVNGWDEEYMNGHGYEDTDFGWRWSITGLPFQLREEIQAEHQWHSRDYEGKDERYNKNLDYFNKKKDYPVPPHKKVRPKKGYKWSNA